MDKITVVFAGTGGIGSPALSELAQNPTFEVTFVVTGEDTIAGRKLIKKASVIKETALMNKLIVRETNKIESLKKELTEAKPDYLLVVDYGEIIPSEILEIPKIAAVNIHPSLLPKYRGPAPIHAPLLYGDKETGVTWILMNERMDAGDIIAQDRMPVAEDDRYESLSKRLSEHAGKRTCEVLIEFSKKRHAKPQDESKATYTKKIKKEDGLLKFNEESAEQMIGKIKAFSVWPACYFLWNGKLLKVIEAAISEQKISPTKVESTKNMLAIGTTTKALLPLVVQLEGKKPVSIKEFLNGQKGIPQSL